MMHQDYCPIFAGVSDECMCRENTFADAATWDQLTPAAQQECLRTDHGMFKCRHHVEPYPPQR